MDIKTIRDAREKYRSESNKPVRIPDWIQVRYEPLDTVPQISLRYKVGGGPFMTFEYTIVGGPDNRKVVELAPWRAEWSICPQAEKYNGTQEEFDACLGYPARPCIYRASESLHISTVMYLCGLLAAEREHSMAGEITRLYDQMDREAAEAEKAVEPRDYHGIASMLNVAAMVITEQAKGTWPKDKALETAQELRTEAEKNILAHRRQVA